MKILVINPGSTSTKVSVYDDAHELFTNSIFHDADVLSEFSNINDQIPFRKKMVLDMLEKENININDIDVYVGRGGSAYSQSEGVTIIDQRLYDDTLLGVGGSSHPAKLGVIIAYELASKYHKSAYTLNPTNLDELIDEARITGIQGIYRKPSSHALNQKAVARFYAKTNNLKYEDLDLIVVHIDGGITVGAHHLGKMIDCNVGSGGDGPFSPTRVGSIPVNNIIEYLENHTIDELKETMSKTGGFVSYFNTSSADKVRQLINQKDKKAKLVWDAMIYNVAKLIGSMACVLKGHVDQIIITGGYIRFDDLIDSLKQYCGYIAPITTISDKEQETLALEVYKLIVNNEKPNKYSGKPVFEEFDFIK